MLITDIKELRLASPTHALDSIDGLVGFIDNSEHDFLEDKLGTPLYDALCQWYNRNITVRSSVSDYQTGYWNRLLLLAQRCVAFDALGRAIGMQAISVNNAGINVSVADEYPAPDKNGKTIDLYRDTCTKEAHAALNQLLRQLEQWCKEQGDDSECSEIVTLWKESRYYYLAAALLIPSCEVLQSYLNIYDSREKFIQLLPDLRFIQEEVLAPAIGEDFFDWIISQVVNGELDDNQPTIMSRLLRKLRKIDTCYLEGRTTVIKVDKQRKIDAHDEGVRLLGQLCDYCRQHQADILTALGDNADAYRHSPLYIEPQPAEPATVPSGSPSGCKCSDFNNPDMALCVTMPLL